MNKKIILRTIIILLIILLICMICLLASMKKQQNDNHSVLLNEEENPFEMEIDNNLEKVSNRNNYYAVKSAVDKFYTYYINFKEEQDKKGLYNILDPEYLIWKDITQENLLTKLPPINESKVGITNMYVSDQTLDIAVYIVQGTLREKQSGKMTNFSIMVKLDSSNRTFTIGLQDYIEATYGTLKLGQPITINTLKPIEKNANNQYEYASISEETYMVDLFNKYKEELLYNRPLAYQQLDESYKNKKFVTQEDFETYVKDNIKNYVIMDLKQYKSNMKNGQIQHMCIDQNGKEYIFQESAVMDYTVILDTYTLDLPEFIEKYETATEKDKIELNMQKIVAAINDKDYHYLYLKLDQTFKTNYYPTEEDLRTYIKQNLYEKNVIQLVDTEKSGQLYINNIRIQNKEDQNSENINMRFIMQLKEGTDFVISFSKE